MQTVLIVLSELCDAGDVPVSVVPTLKVMADTYALSSVGGERSSRFEAYLEACRSGGLLHGFNPMTTQPVAEVIESMLGFDAERVVLDAGQDTAARLRVDEDISLFVSVAAPGLWTDKLANTIEHRLAPRHVGELLLWFDDEQNEATVRREAIEQTVRAVWWRRLARSRPSLADVMAREGLSGLAAGRQSSWSACVAEAVEVLGDDRSRGPAVACLFGDDAADRLGFSPLGIGVGEGTEHAVAALGHKASSRSIAETAAQVFSVRSS